MSLSSPPIDFGGLVSLLSTTSFVNVELNYIFYMCVSYKDLLQLTLIMRLSELAHQRKGNYNLNHNFNHNLNQTQPSKNPNLKQTVDLSALQLCPSEVLRVLEPRAWTILNQSISFDSYRYVDWR